MTGWITSFLFAASVALAHAQDGAVVVGAVVSQSGSQAELAAGYAKGILLWAAQVNASGGLLGRPVELKMLDDGSDAIRAGELYRQLIREGKADVLIGPYGSAATFAAAAEAVRERKVMVNGAGPARVVQQGPNPLLFQSTSSYAARGEGVLQVARKAGITRLQMFARQDFAAQEIAEATRLIALKQGFTVPEVETYSPYTMDFTPFVQRAMAEQAQAWIAFGEARDAIDMVKTFRKHGYAPQLFFAQRAAEPAFVAGVGQDAEYTLAEVQYDARLPRPANAEFVKAYTAKWSAAPALAAAEGYSAASVLGEGVRRAGSLDTEKLRAALAALRTETPLGSYQVGANGQQVGIVPAVVQIQRGKPQVIWPNELLTAQPMQPYLPWKERQVLR
ncbi:MAG TPA: ABC transporter substrate-binding protein [Burkholderiales bacterium]|nr:ABC transporter substrate-binding protein [Burkholderiales bacterium]